MLITPKDVVATEKDIEQLWSLLEDALEILEELCIVYLEKGEEKNRQAAMEETQSLEPEIQAPNRKYSQAVKSQGQISTEIASHKDPVTYLNLPIVLQGPPNPASPPQSSHSDQVEAGISQSSPTGSSANHRLKPLKMPSYGGDKTKFEEFWGLF